MLDPDEQVQGAVRLVFDTFGRTGSAGAVVRCFQEQQVAWPRRVVKGPRAGALVFGELERDRVSSSCTIRATRARTSTVGPGSASSAPPGRRGIDASETPSLFEFLVLTAARSAEARLATWEEMDLGGLVWTVPATRMKTGREHRVPLCRRAVELLAEARRLVGDSAAPARGGVVFPSRRGKALHNAMLSGLLKELGIGAVPHGFRSSFRDWASERTDHPREVIEAALAHVVRNQTEAAYARSDLFERRRRLMDDWMRYLNGRRSHGPASP